MQGALAANLAERARARASRRLVFQRAGFLRSAGGIRWVSGLLCAADCFDDREMDGASESRSCGSDDARAVVDGFDAS